MQYHYLFQYLFSAVSVFGYKIDMSMACILFFIVLIQNEPYNYAPETLETTEKKTPEVEQQMAALSV